MGVSDFVAVTVAADADADDVLYVNCLIRLTLLEIAFALTTLRRQSSDTQNPHRVNYNERVDDHYILADFERTRGWRV